MTSRNQYDAVIVGARAAGAATAMLLARRGLRVLVLDRAQYGSDTLSTHGLMRTGVLQLHRWNLLGAIRDAGTPPIHKVLFRYPDRTDEVEIQPGNGVDALYAPRRTVLDRILVDAARVAGAEFRFGVIVDDLLRDDSGRVTGVLARSVDRDPLSVKAGIVIGADGIRSIVAQAVGAQRTKEARVGGGVVYGYFRNLEAEGYEWAYAPGASAGLFPTNDGEVCVFTGTSTFRFRNDVQLDIATGFRRILAEASKEFAARVSGGIQTGRFRGFNGVRGYSRRPFGRGWALVGDAGYFRDPITMHGISDAFRDAELLARAITDEISFSDYERIRDDMSSALFDVTERIAGYDWTMDEVRGHLRDISRATRAELRLLLDWDAAEAA